MIFVFNRSEEVIDLLQNDGFFNDEYKTQVNGEWTYTFHIDNINSNIIKGNKIGFYDEYKNFQLFTIDDTEEVFSYSKAYDLKVSCIHDFYSLRYEIIEDKRIINGSAKEALLKCLEGTSYLVGEVDELGTNDINFYYTSTLKGLNDIVKKFSGELHFRLELNELKTAISKRYVDIRSRLGEDTGLRFTFDLNLKEVKRKVYGEHYTVLYGRGSSLESGDGFSRKLTFEDVKWVKPNNIADKPLGKKYIEHPEGIKKYGRITGIFEDNNINGPEELLNATWNKLVESLEPNISYSASVEDLSNIFAYDHLKVSLGDTICILDNDYNLNIESRVIEQKYSIKNKDNKIVVLGNFLKGLSDNNNNIFDRLDKIESKPTEEVNDTKFPDTLPGVPILKAKGLFATISLEWTYENKTYYTYEVYASRVRGFNVDFTNLIFKGKASSFLHEVKPSETWYYRIRVVNTHNSSTQLSEEISASTTKLADGTEYFDNAAIKDALIGELRLDRGWVGKLVGNHIDAKNLTVTDGNGKKTFEVDSFGNVNMDVASLKISSKGVATEDYTNDKINSLTISNRNLITTSKKEEEKGLFIAGLNYTLFANKCTIETLKLNDIITVDFDVDYDNFLKTATGDQNSRILIQGSGNVTEWDSGGFGQYTFTDKIDWTNKTGTVHVQYTMKINSNHIRNNYWNIALRLDYINGNSIKLKNLQIVKGTKVGDWQSSPEMLDKYINDAKDQADAANEKLAEIASDNKLTPSEKQSTKLNWDSIVSEYSKMIADCDKYSISITNYKSKYDTLNTYITPLLSNLNVTSDVVGTTFRTNFKNYYDARQDIVSDISSKINTNASDAQIRVESVEQLVKDGKIITTINTALADGKVIDSTSMTMDKDGFTVKNGAITVKNKAGKIVLEGDKEGNLGLTGKFTTSANIGGQGQRIELSSGQMDFFTYGDTNPVEKVASIVSTSFPSDRNQNGICLATVGAGDYICIGYGDTGSNGLMSITGAMYFVPTDYPASGLPYTAKGIYARDNFYFSRAGYSIQTNDKWHKVFDANNGHLGMFGDNGVMLGIREGNNNRTLMHLKEHSGHRFYGELEVYTDIKGNVNNGIYNFNNIKTIANLTTRSYTETYSIDGEYNQTRIIFSDVQISNGKAYINIPNKYINMYESYSVSSIVKKGKGDIWIEEEETDRILFSSDTEIKFNVEIVLKMKLREGAKDIEVVEDNNESRIIRT